MGNSVLAELKRIRCELRCLQPRVCRLDVLLQSVFRTPVIAAGDGDPVLIFMLLRYTGKGAEN